MTSETHVKQLCQNIAALRDAGAIKPITATRIVSGLLAEVSGSGWRVIGITPYALSFLQDKQWKVGGSKVQRAHLYPRIETVTHILQNVQTMSGTEMLAYCASRDMTVMCHSFENKRITELTWFPIHNDDGALFKSGNVGYRYALKREGDVLKKLWQASQDGKVSPDMSMADIERSIPQEFR
ncbi:MAG: hypothetical protein ACWA40_08985 [Planktomarina sp.]